ncbi:glyoxalase [Streptomyces sp. ALB3]|uniref:glyoxalase n=1 Tax=Streptomyces sp. ALB3 TaxID=3374278 RepID=UPI00378D551D
MTSLASVTLEVDDPAAAGQFYAAAFGLGSRSRVRAPDGALRKIATSAKKDKGPDTREIDRFVLLPGAEDVLASKRFHVGRGLTVGKSFGPGYVEFDTPSSPVTPGLHGRRAPAKDAGVAPDGTGSHRIAIDSGPFTDPDGFEWRRTSG